jgi:hypothetical protein
MSLSRVWAVAILSLTVVFTHIGWSGGQEPAQPSPFRVSQQPQPVRSAPKDGLTCTIYRLAEFGDDPAFGNWIADTIPRVIQPGTWNGGAVYGSEPERRTLTYYAPAQILVVYHTPAVQVEIGAFLKKLKKVLPQEQKATAKSAKRPQSDGVIQLDYVVPQVVKTASAVPAAKAPYPVPPPLQQPKHLFHFIIRYEGEGVVDSNVTGLVKNLSGQEEAEQPEKSKAEPASPSALKGLFHFILRYEGDGIIDSNVAQLVKDLYSQDTRWSSPPTCVSNGSSSNQSGTVAGAPYGPVQSLQPSSGVPTQQNTPYGDVPYAPPPPGSGGTPPAAFTAPPSPQPTQPATAATNPAPSTAPVATPAPLKSISSNSAPISRPRVR